jgi:hypothetical protein
MLAPPKPRKGGHEVDAYETLPGAMPTRAKVRETTEKPLERPLTKEELALRKEAQLEATMRAERYTRYLDALVEFGGDQEQALADVFGMPIDEVRPQRLVLQKEVRTGLAHTTLADELERQDLTQAARMTLLRRHAYSANPAASLKAIDMINDLEGDRADTGTFESFLRLAKGNTR